MTLELTDRECEVLFEVLEIAHRGRTLELHRTDSLAYKGMLQEKVRIIEELISRVAVQGTGARAGGA
jgi:hypothetical protein